MFEVVFLGTGAAVPTRFRNLSSTALIFNGELFLFDCGEGAQIQFRKARLRPGRLSRIFISHFHGDHLFGLPGLLTSLQMAECTQPIHLYGPEGLAEYVDFHKKFARFGLRYPLHVVEVPDGSDGMSWQESGYQILCKPIAHRIRCLGWAIVENARPGKFDVEAADRLGVPNGPDRGRLQKGEAVELSDGRTILPEQVVGASRRGHHFAYCMDTSPTPNAIALAKGADLLIHDSTFKEGEEQSALQSGHSTATQAAHIAREADVHLLALNHISGRYMPFEEKELLDSAKTVFPRTVIASDLKRMTFEYEA